MPAAGICAYRYSAHDDKCAATAHPPTPAIRVEDLISASAPTHFSDHRGRGHFHQQHMVKPDTVEGVFQRDAALNFMGFDHPRSIPVFTMVSGALPAATARCVTASQPSPEYRRVVGRMAPLGGKPGIVKIEPADHRANVKRKLPVPGGSSWNCVSARHACAVGAPPCCWHDRPKLQFYRPGSASDHSRACRASNNARCRTPQRGDLVIHNVINDINVSRSKSGRMLFSS